MEYTKLNKTPKGLMIALGLATALMVSAAPKTVHGLVRDARTKAPVNAAQISVLNEKFSATSDENGRFTIKTESSGTLLIIQAYNFDKREFPLQGKDSITIDLLPESFQDAYLSSEAALSTEGIYDFSTSSSISADLEIQKALAGSVRSITRSGTTGNGSSVFIRGLSSISSMAQPLYLIDGVIRNSLYEVQSIHGGFFSNPLANIDATDIESIEILKDGSAVYGSKGANGVIVIRTKRGNSLATKINLNISTGYTGAPKTMPVMNAEAYKTYLTEIMGTAGFSNSELEQLPFLSDNPARYTYNQYHNDTNWKDYIYRTGSTHNYDISVNGGDEKALYYFALGYTGNQGVLKSTDFGRYNLRLNADIKLSKVVTLSLNTGFSRIDRNMIDDGVNSLTSPAWMSLIKSPILSPYNFTFSGAKTTEFAYADIFNVGNPVAIQSNSINTLKQTSFNISLIPTIKLSKDFELTDQFDYYLNKTDEDSYRPYLYSATYEIPGIGTSYNTRASQVMRDNSISNDLKLRFRKSLANNQELEAELGNRYMYDYYESDYVEGHNSMSNSVINLRGSFDFLATGGRNDMVKDLNNYVNVKYIKDNKYFLDLAGSMESSSKFGKETLGGMQLFGHSWGLFPSANAAWLVSSEDFMKSIGFMNHLKLRAGYDITGNDNFLPYQTKSYFESVPFKGVANGLVLSSLANPAIQWETSYSTHAGIDLHIFGERMVVRADVYDKTTKDLLLPVSLPEVSGLGYFWKNGGVLSNKGIELSANLKILNLKDVQWEAGLSAGHYKNLVKELPGNSYYYEIGNGTGIIQEGLSLGTFYGYKTLGVFADESSATSSGLKTDDSKGQLKAFGAGDIIFEDLSGPNGIPDGIIDENDKQIIGNSNPDWYGSFSSALNIHQLKISVLFTYNTGNDIYNYARSILESGKDFSNQSPALKGRWTADGQNTLIPRVTYGDPMGNGRFSDRWIEDGSYLKLKNITASYKLPIKVDFLEGINLWASAENLFSWTNYLGADPEFSSMNQVLGQGVDFGLLPQSKSYYFGIQLNL